MMTCFAIGNLILFIVILLLEANTVHSLRILGIFPFMGKSHFVMNEQLMRGLARRGHQVDVYSHFPLKKSQPNYTDYSLSGSKPVMTNNIHYEIIDSLFGYTLVPTSLNMFGKPICGLMNLSVFQKLIKKPPEDPPYDVVIVEPFFASCYLAFGRHLNVPMVAVVTTVTLFEWLNEPLGNPTNLAADPCISSRAAPPMTFFERMQNFLNYIYMTISYNYYVRDQNEVIHKIFGPNYPSVIELQKDISLTLVNYHHALNGVRPFTPVIIPVGGLHISETDEELPKNVQIFLDESNDGFIYFSFGSMVRIETFPKRIINVLYSSFKKIAPIRVLMKVGKLEEIPPGFPTNVVTQSWLPQIKVLKHKNIKAFITHGGCMGTQESIYYGVPMIGFPLFDEQHFNLESLAKRNLAIKLDRNDITEEILTEAILEILKNPIYKKSIEKVRRRYKDTPMSPIDTAAYWVEYVTRHGKNVLRPPTVDMPWWQTYLLDVYAFIISTVLVMMYLIKIIFKKLIEAILSMEFRYCIKKEKKSI